MYRIFMLVLTILTLVKVAIAQDAQEIISAVQKKQASLKTISYDLHRTDTLVTGHVRTITGKAKLFVSHQDKLFGCLFWAQRDGFDQQTIYNGYVAYVADTTRKMYSMISKPSENLLYGTTGGQVILLDLIRLDTTQAVNSTFSQDQHNYYLTFYYPDLVEHDVYKRYKAITISKSSMLPIAVRKHQETLGKVQDLNFQARNLDLNSNSYDFYDAPFLKDYVQETASADGAAKQSKLRDTEAPSISLPAFDSTKSYSVVTEGKVTLLDFWEVWCGPCIASMPKVQQIYDRYKDRGLVVYGIVHETGQIDISKKRAEKAKATFPMLIGNKQSKDGFQLAAIPLYVLIDKQGMIIYAKEGYSADLEQEIQKALDH